VAWRSAAMESGIENPPSPDSVCSAETNAAAAVKITSRSGEDCARARESIASVESSIWYLSE